MTRVSQLSSLYTIAGPGHRTFGARGPSRNADEDLKCTVSMQGGKDRRDLEPWINMKPHPCLFFFYFQMEDMRTVWECQQDFSSLYNFLPFDDKVDEWDVCVQLISTVRHLHEQGYSLSADDRRPSLQRSSTSDRISTGRISLNPDEDDSVFDHVLCAMGSGKPWIKICQTCTLYRVSPQRLKGDLRHLLRMCSVLGVDDPDESTTPCLRTTALCATIDELYKLSLASYSAHDSLAGSPHPLTNPGILAYWRAHWYNHRGIGMWHIGNTSEAMHFFEDAEEILPECIDARLNRILADSTLTEVEKLRHIRTLPPTSIGNACTMSLLLRLRMWRDALQFAQRVVTKDRMQSGQRKNFSRKAVTVEDWTGATNDHERTVVHLLASFTDAQKEQAHVQYIDEMAGYAKAMWQTFGLHFLVAPHFLKEEGHMNGRLTLKSALTKKELDNHEWAEFRVFGNTAGFLWRLVENLTTRCAGAQRISPMASTFFASYPGVDIGANDGTKADFLPAHGNSGFLIDLIPPAFALFRLSQEAIDKLEPTKEPSVRKEGYSEFVNAIRLAGTGIFLHLSSDKREADAWVVQTDTMMPVASRASLVVAVKNGIEVYISFVDGGIQKFFLPDSARFVFRQTDQKKRSRPIVCLEKRQLFENTPAMDPDTFQFLSLVYSPPSDCLICYLKVKKPSTLCYALQVQWLSTQISLLHTACVPHELTHTRRTSIKESRRSGFDRRRSCCVDPIKGRESLIPLEEPSKRNSALTPHEYDNVNAAAPSRNSLNPMRESTTHPKMVRRRSSFQFGAVNQPHHKLFKDSEDSGLVDAFAIVRNDEALCGFATRVEWWDVPMCLPRSLIPTELPRALNKTAKLTVTLPNNDVAVRWALSEDCLACICLLEDLRIFVIDAVVGDLLQECLVSCPCTPFPSFHPDVPNHSHADRGGGSSRGFCRAQHAPLPRDAHATLTFSTNTVFAVCVHGIASFFHLDSPTDDEGFHSRSSAPRVRRRVSARRTSIAPSSDISSDDGDEKADDKNVNAPKRFGKRDNLHRRNSASARTSTRLWGSSSGASPQSNVSGRLSKTCVPGRFGELNDAARERAQRTASVAGRNMRLLHERHEWLLAHKVGYHMLKPLRTSPSDAPLTAPFDRVPLPRGASELVLLLPLLPFVRTDGWEATCVVVTLCAVVTLVDLTGSCRVALMRSQAIRRERRARITVELDSLTDGGNKNAPPSKWVADLEPQVVDDDENDEEDHWTSMLDEKRRAYARPTSCHGLQHSPYNIQQALRAHDAIVAKLEVDVRSTVSWQSLAHCGQLERREALKDYISSMQLTCHTVHRVATLMTLLGIRSHRTLYNTLWRPLGEKLYSAPFGPCFVYTQLHLEGGAYNDDCVAQLRNFLDHRTGGTVGVHAASGGAASGGYSTPVSSVATMGGELGLAMAAPPILADCVFGEKTVMHWRAPASVHATGDSIPGHSPIASVACTDTADVVLVTLYEGTAEIWRMNKMTAEQEDQCDPHIGWERVLYWDAHGDAPYIFDNSTARGPLGALSPIGGQLCVTAGRELKLWDTVDGEHLGTLAWASNEPAEFLFYSENCTIICVVTKHGVYVWRGLELCLVASAQVVAMCAQSGSLGSSTGAGDLGALARFRRKTMAGLRSTMTAAAMCRTGHYIALCVRNAHVVVFAHDPRDLSSEPFSRILCCCCARESGGSLSSVNHLAITSTGCMLVQGSSILQIWHLPSQQVPNAAPHYVTASRAPTPPMYTTGRNASCNTLTLPRHTVTLLSPIPDSRLQSAVATPIPDRLEPAPSRRAVAVDVLQALANAAPPPHSPSRSCAPNSNASPNTPLTAQRKSEVSVPVEEYRSPIPTPRTPISLQSHVAPQGRADAPAPSCALTSPVPTVLAPGRRPNFTARCARVQVQSPMGTQRSPMPVLCAPSPLQDDTSPHARWKRPGSVDGYRSPVPMLHTPIPHTGNVDQRTTEGISTYVVSSRRPAVPLLGNATAHFGMRSPVPLDGYRSPIPAVHTPVPDSGGAASYAQILGTASGDAYRSPVPIIHAALPTSGDTSMHSHVDDTGYADASWPAQVLSSTDYDLPAPNHTLHRMPPIPAPASIVQEGASGINFLPNDVNSQDGRGGSPVDDPSLQTKLLARTMRKEVLHEAHDVQARWRLEDWRGHWVVEPHTASVVVCDVDARTAALYILPPIKERKRTANNASTATPNARMSSHATPCEHLERLVPSHVTPAPITAAWMWSDVAGTACTPATHSVLCAFAPRYSQFVVALGADLRIFHANTDWYCAVSAFRADVFSSTSVGATAPRTSTRARSIRPTSSLTCGNVLGRTPDSAAHGVGDERVSLGKSKTFATRMVASGGLTKQFLTVGESLEAEDGRRSIRGVSPSGNKRVSFENDFPGNRSKDDLAWPRAPATIDTGPSYGSALPAFPHVRHLVEGTSPVTSPQFSPSHRPQKSTEGATQCFLPLVPPARGAKLCSIRDDRSDVKNDDHTTMVVGECATAVLRNDHNSTTMSWSGDHNTSPRTIPGTGDDPSASTPCLNLMGIAMAKHPRCTNKKGRVFPTGAPESLKTSGDAIPALKDAINIEETLEDSGGQKKELAPERQPRAVRRLTAMVLPAEIGAGPLPRASRIASLQMPLGDETEAPKERPLFVTRRSTALALPLDLAYMRSSAGEGQRAKEMMHRLSTMPLLKEDHTPHVPPKRPIVQRQLTMAEIPNSALTRDGGRKSMSFAFKEADAAEPPSIWDTTLFIDPSLIYIGCPRVPSLPDARTNLRKKTRKPKKYTVAHNVAHEPFMALIHPRGFTHSNSGSDFDSEADAQKEKRSGTKVAYLNAMSTLTEPSAIISPPKSMLRKPNLQRTQMLAQPVNATIKRDTTLVRRYLCQSVVPIVPDNVLRRLHKRCPDLAD